MAGTSRARGHKRNNDGSPSSSESDQQSLPASSSQYESPLDQHQPANRRRRLTGQSNQPEIRYNNGNINNRRGGPSHVNGNGSYSQRDDEEEGEDLEDQGNSDDEAAEELVHIDDGLDQDNNQSNSEESEGEDLLGENMMDDYRPMGEYDNYEIDEEAEMEEDRLSAGARAAAERELRRRDRENHLLQGGRMGTTLLMDSSDEEQDTQPSFSDSDRKRRRDRRNHETSISDVLAPSYNGPTSEDVDRDFLDDGGDITLEDYQGSLREWLQNEQVKRKISRLFYLFLMEYSDLRTGKKVHLDRIRLMCSSNSQSLTVSYNDLSTAEPVLAVWLADEPGGMIEIMNSILNKVTLKLFPEYASIHPQTFVRISDLPILDNIRDIRYIHLNSLVKVSGVVTRRSSVFPQLSIIKLRCVKCNAILDPGISTGLPEKSVRSCFSCSAKGPFVVDSQHTIFKNYQKLTIQETPGSVPAGRLPRYKEVVLYADLVDSTRPGDEIEVTGIYKHIPDISLSTRNGFPVFGTFIEANFIRRHEDAYADVELTDEDIAEMQKLASDPRIEERIYASIAPSIYGHKNIKMALALGLFGGQAKVHEGKHRTRGDINILLMGDPGTAKSQFLKYVEKTAHRAVYTTGKGASAVGLTASVHRDPATREWTLEGGALVLADQGVCLIDEFDKMNDQDRTSIHEAMEQQSISISKAGIVTSLQARCSVFASANPVKGRYDPSISFFENVDLTEPILSRFDVLCVVRDVVDPIVDETLARFVVDSHMASHPSNDPADINMATRDEERIQLRDNNDITPIPQDKFRKYIFYARRNVRPRWPNHQEKKLENVYVDLRRESMGNGGIPIAVRHLESMIRLAEAHARIHLRDYVREDDVNCAISVMLESFFQSQKYSVMRVLRRKFHKYLTYKKDEKDLLLHILGQLSRDYALAVRSEVDDRVVEIPQEDFESRARELGIFNVSGFYSSEAFLQRGFQLDLRQGKISRRII